MWGSAAETFGNPGGASMSSTVSRFSGRDLQRVRAIREYSRTDLAAEVGVAHETLVAWEREQSTPRADSLATLSKVLGCSIDAFFTNGTENDPA